MRIKLTALALVALSITGCEFFSSVTIPGTDYTPPTPWTTVYFDGAHQRVSTGADPLSYTMVDPDQGFFILSSAIDSGGAAEVVMEWDVEHFCRSESLGQVVVAVMVPGHAAQSGQVGDVVSSGVWTAQYIRFADMSNPCAPGWDWFSSTVTWMSAGMDFAGNRSEHGWARVTHYR